MLFYLYICLLSCKKKFSPYSSCRLKSTSDTFRIQPPKPTISSSCSFISFQTYIQALLGRKWMKKKITNIMTTCSSDSLANTGLNYISPPHCPLSQSIFSIYKRSRNFKSWILLIGVEGGSFVYDRKFCSIFNTLY